MSKNSDSNNQSDVNKKVVSLFDREIIKYQEETGVDPLDGLDFICNQAKDSGMDNFLLIGFNEEGMWFNVNTTLNREDLKDALIEAIYYFKNGLDKEI